MCIPRDKTFHTTTLFLPGDLDLELWITYTKCCYLNLVAFRRTSLSSDNSCLFCPNVTLTFGIWSWKFIGLLDEIHVLPLYQPSFTEIHWTITEKIVFNRFAKDVSSWLNLYPPSPKFLSGRPLVNNYKPAKFKKDRIYIADCAFF